MRRERWGIENLCEAGVFLDDWNDNTVAHCSRTLWPICFEANTWAAGRPRQRLLYMASQLGASTMEAVTPTLSDRPSDLSTRVYVRQQLGPRA
jgi:hypothetical protein